jgi:hypothetical protein
MGSRATMAAAGVSGYDPGRWLEEGRVDAGVSGSGGRDKDRSASANSLSDGLACRDLCWAGAGDAVRLFISGLALSFSIAVSTRFENVKTRNKQGKSEWVRVIYRNLISPRSS